MRTVQLWVGLGAVLALGGEATAQAPAGSGLYEVHGFAWRPRLEVFGEVGVTRPSYRLDCVGPCGPSRGSSVYLGGMFNRYVGAQFGYVQLGEADRAEGFNLSLVGRAPVLGGLGVYGRLGTTWGRTQGRLPGGAGLSLGSASGWGPAYGLGLDWAFAERWSAVLDWQRHRFDFSGDEAGWVRSTSVGLKYRF